MTDNQRTAVPTGLVVIICVVLLALATLMGVVLVTQGQIRDDVESVTRDLISYPTRPWTVDAVTEDTVEITGKTCFEGTEPWRTESTEVWRFRFGPSPGYAGFYRAGDLSVLYGEPGGIPVDDVQCNEFEGFGQPMPPDLLRDLEDHCGEDPVTMYIEFKVSAIELTTGDSSAAIIVNTEDFTITPPLC